jgi:uncharacterized protein YbjT (DUF2867 family)
LGADLVGDEIFIALGATKKTSPQMADYYRVDHDYPVLAARVAKDQGAKAVFLVSAVGANPDSNIFYVRTKGETERDIIALDFEHTHVFRVSMIMGNRQENRPLERILIKVWSVINPLLVGKADRYRGMTGEEIAKAMSLSATTRAEKLKIYHWKEMKALLQR